MRLGTAALKVSRVPDAIVAGRYLWQPWNALKISENNLPEKILTLATKCKRGREERVLEFAIAKLLICKDQLITLHV